MKNIPIILNISKKRKIIKFNFIKKNTTLKNEILLKKNIEFLRKINSFKFNKIKFGYAKDFKNKGISYSTELKQRLRSAKLNLSFLKKKQIKYITSQIEKKICLLNEIKYFKAFKRLKKDQLILSPCDFHYKNMIIRNINFTESYYLLYYFYPLLYIFL